MVASRSARFAIRCPLLLVLLIALVGAGGWGGAPAAVHAQSSDASPTDTAPSAPDSPLTVQQIMQEPATWIGDWPENLRWGERGQHLYFDWNPKGQFESDSLYRVARAGGAPEKVDPATRRAAHPFFAGWQHGAHVYSADQTEKVYVHDGDLYRYDRTTGTQTRLTDTPVRERSPRFDLDDERVIYRAEEALFALDRSTGLRRQLTDLRPGTAPSDPERDAQEEFLREQQLELFETLKEREAEDEAREAAQEREAAADDPPPTFYYGDRSVQQLVLGPQERFVTFGLSDAPREERNTTVVSYVTESGYADEIPARPKVGSPRSSFALYVQDLQRDTTYEVDLHQLPGAYDVPAYRAEQGADLDSTEAKRSLYAYGPYWSPEGEHAVLVVRARNNKDRWIARLDPADGSLTVLDRQHDDAWIGGPGIGAYGGPGTIGWVPGDDATFFFQSEATGYSHLYTVDVATGTTQQLTSGDYEIYDPRLSKDGSTWTFASSRRSPHERHVYQMPVGGGPMVRLTARAGQTTAALSPDGARMGLRFDQTDRPPDVYLKDTPVRGVGSNGTAPERITTSPTEAWQRYDWRTPDIVRFEASDGVEVPTRIYRPDDPNGAAVLFVHGAGYLQNVVNGWTVYFREYMFHNLLTDLGYTVLDVDYRGSAGYGRDWRTAIYRHMGGRDLQDYVDASRWLEETEGIDPERQFIYGGSYGGFMTLMALFTAPDRFGGGAALRSVTDWAHYNDVYTANILNTPQTDSLAYARSSPIYHAEGLEDPLLMAHGLVDTNVQPQDIFRLSQRLIELGKENWQLAMYPVEGHGFETPSSWTDEYRRILELIQTSVGPAAEQGEARAYPEHGVQEE